MTKPPIKVLIADDDEFVRSALAALVETEPGLVLVGAAGDGDAATRLAEEVKPDVALLDVRMPGGGAPLVRGIGTRSPVTKILVLSAFGDRATVLDMLEAGAVGYLVKGASIDAIVESIRRAATAGEPLGRGRDELHRHEHGAAQPGALRSARARNGPTVAEG